MFNVGDLVECVNPMARCIDGKYRLSKGSVYTIREIVGESLVRLEEIADRPVDRDGPDAPYLASRFRPFRSKHIELFREIVANPKAPIKELV